MRDGIGAQSRIPEPVEAGVMLEGNGGCDLMTGAACGDDRLGSLLRMDGHFLPLLPVESAGIIENLGGDRHFADVVEKGAGTDRNEILLRQAEVLAGRHRHQAGVDRVIEGVLVVALDGAEQQRGAVGVERLVDELLDRLHDRTHLEGAFPGDPMIEIPQCAHYPGVGESQVGEG